MHSFLVISWRGQWQLLPKIRIQMLHVYVLFVRHINNSKQVWNTDERPWSQKWSCRSEFWTFFRVRFWNPESLYLLTIWYSYWKWPIEIAYLPMKKMVISSSQTVNVYQAGYSSFVASKWFASHSHQSPPWGASNVGRMLDRSEAQTFVERHLPSHGEKSDPSACCFHPYITPKKMSNYVKSSQWKREQTAITKIICNNKI